MIDKCSMGFEGCENPMLVTIHPEHGEGLYDLRLELAEEQQFLRDIWQQGHDAHAPQVAKLREYIAVLELALETAVDDAWLAGQDGSWFECPEEYIRKARQELARRVNDDTVESQAT